MPKSHRDTKVMRICKSHIEMPKSHIKMPKSHRELEMSKSHIYRDAKVT